MTISGKDGWPFAKGWGLPCPRRVRRGPQLPSAQSGRWHIRLSSLWLQQHRQGHTAPHVCTGFQRPHPAAGVPGVGREPPRALVAVPAPRLSGWPVGLLSLRDAPLSLTVREWTASESALASADLPGGGTEAH